MPRFPAFKTATLLACSMFATAALAVSLADLSNQEASSGLKAALEKGAVAAVGKLGVQDGFLGNDKVKIQLPGMLEQARPLLKMSGHGQQLDDLVVSMNRAAEAAVPLAKPLLLNAVKSMSVTDAKNILAGGETSVTDFFRRKDCRAAGREIPARSSRALPTVPVFPPSTTRRWRRLRSSTWSTSSKPPSKATSRSARSMACIT